MDVYQELGVQTFINARAPHTRFGGAIMADEVVAAMAAAARWGVHIAEMQEKVGKAIASLTRNEAAYVSCGAASGITLAVATCICGTDEKLADRLPDSAGMRNKILMHACDCGTECDVSIRCAGGKIVKVGDERGATAQQFEAALDEGVAAIMLLSWVGGGRVPPDQVVALARSRGIPVLVDGAGAVPPRENFWRWTASAGVDAIIISGGKGIGGPQSTGLVLGKSWVVEGCSFHGVPNVRLGRGMKVGKEELAGIYVAVKRAMEVDEVSEHKRHTLQADAAAEALADIPGVTISRPRPHLVRLQFSETAIGMSFLEAYQWLLSHQPGILMHDCREGISFNTGMLKAGQEQIVVRQVREFFSANGRS